MIGFVDPYTYSSVPTGIIVPWNSNAHVAPTGWTFFTAPNAGVGGFSGCYIRAAGNTIAVNTTGIGGSPAGHVRFDSTPDGNHRGAQQKVAYTQITESPSHNPSWRLEGGEYAGEHTHTLDATPILGYKQYQFIRATSQVEKFPKNSVLLNTTHDASALGLIYNQVSSTGNFLRAGDRADSGETSCPITMDVTLDNGKHVHSWWPAYWALSAGGTNSHHIFYSDVGPSWDGRAGYHLHTINSASISDNIQRVYTTAWTNTSVDFLGFKGMIAFWDGVTPATLPEGWSLCNGTNGTIDMREHFIMMGLSAGGTVYSLGYKTGTNKINITPASGNMLASQNFTNLLGGVGHRHHENEYIDRSGVEGVDWRETWSWHDSYLIPHSHASTQGTNLSYYPQYYALHPIQKI